MLLNYNLKTTIVRRLTYVTHIGKKRNAFKKPDAHAWYGHEMIYVDYGKMNLIMDGAEITLNPGECIFIHGGVTHSFKGEENMPFSYLNIMFRGTLPDDFFQHVFTVDRRLRKLLEELREESLGETFLGKEMFGVIFTELIIRFMRHMKAPHQQHFTKPAYLQNYKSATVEKTMKAIIENYSHPLTLTKLGLAVGVSESHLRALLRKETGKNFSSIIHSLRLEAAKRLLLEGTIPMNGIAAAVGYSDPSFFFKIFKRLTGVTPKAYASSLGDPSAEQAIF
jgi:AraC-like DNA-binding protein